MREKLKYEWKGALKAMVIVAVLCVGIGIAVAAWDDTKNTSDTLTAAEWNAMTADQKNAIKKDGSVAMTDWLTFSGDYGINRNGTTGSLTLLGGDSYSAKLTLDGKDSPGSPGYVRVIVPDVSLTSHLIALSIKGGTAIPRVETPYGFFTDEISEITPAHGVTVDSCLIKDGKAADADKLDGYSAAAFMLLDGTSAMAGNLDINENDILDVRKIKSPTTSNLEFYRGAGRELYLSSGSVIIDNTLLVDTIEEFTLNADITFNDPIKVDALKEKSTGAGVTIDSCLIKDGYPYIPNHTPSNASEACTAGQLCYDSNYTYVCIATDTWERAALSSW